MSRWSSLRDSVITPSLVSTINAETGLNLSMSQDSSASPSGAVGQGGVPNKNPSIFGSISTDSWIFIGIGLIAVLFLFRLKR